MWDVRPSRKRVRRPNYDYSLQGAYFITICAKDRAHVFGRIAGTAQPYTELSELGQIVRDGIDAIPRMYAMVHVSKSIIMPNHVHLLVSINSIDNAPAVSQVIQQWKGSITKRAGFSPWQKSFHDHIIHGREEYEHIARYIDNNPLYWEQDHLFTNS